MYKEGGASQIYPDKFEEFLAPIPHSERGDLVEAYRKQLTGDDKEVQLAAAKAWSFSQVCTGSSIGRRTRSGCVWAWAVSR